MPSILLHLLALNLPLGHCDKYNAVTVDRWSAPDMWGNKALDNTARKLVNALSQYKVAEQMAKEWEGYPPLLRLRITAIANEARGHASGNVTKGIQRLNDVLGGKILARETGPTERTLQIIDGRKVSVDKRFNPAVAGAYRAFSGYALPPNFNKLPKAEQKRIRQQLAAERRVLKGR